VVEVVGPQTTGTSDGTICDRKMMYFQCQ